MFEDDGSHWKNIIFGLGGGVKEFFDAQKVTDFIVNNCKSVGQLSSAKFNRYSGSQRAINTLNEKMDLHQICTAQI